MKQFIVTFLIAPLAVGSAVAASTNFRVQPFAGGRAGQIAPAARVVRIAPAVFAPPKRSAAPAKNPPAAPVPFSVPFFATPVKNISAHTFSANANPLPVAPAKNYIVVMKDGPAAQGIAPDAFARGYGLTPNKIYKSALRGFAVKLTDTDLAKLRADSRVRFISEDREVSIAGFSSASGQGGFSSAPLKQVVPTGIRRIGAIPPHFPSSKGTGVTVAVIDTGIDLTHPDLRDGIIANTNCVDPKATGNDDHGHGSHVAGTIAGRNNMIGVVGVAPEAKLIAVKVLNAGGSGSWASVICGVDWVTSHANQYNIKVANMSLGGWGSSDNNCGITNNDAFHMAVCNSAAAGVTYVVAAGNSGSDAAGFVPAAYTDTLITVSALADSDGVPGGQGPATSRGADDTFATFSNYGAAVDIGAPGVDIYSSFKNGLYHVYSGTSMASPHVAGSAARYIQTHSVASSWQQVLAGLQAVAEPLGSGHIDPSGKHPEPIVRANF